jgi:hypothetical protein
MAATEPTAINVVSASLEFFGDGPAEEDFGAGLGVGLGAGFAFSRGEAGDANFAGARRLLGCSKAITCCSLALLSCSLMVGI